MTLWRLSSSQPGPPGGTHPSLPGQPRYAPSLVKCLSAGQVIEGQSTDYTLEEVDEALQLLTKHGQWVGELLAAGGEAGFAGPHEFEQVQRAVLGEVRAQVEGAESWLKR